MRIRFAGFFPEPVAVAAPVPLAVPLAVPLVVRAADPVFDLGVVAFLACCGAATMAASPAPSVAVVVA